MYNYEDFEAELPRDKGTQKFLVSDYFHDSELRSVVYDGGKKSLEITLQCCRDWESEGRGERSDPRYTYILRFFGVAGFVSRTDLTWPEYINGRFKHTAWLEARQRETKRKLYHFRIGLADGYMDILFSRFQIRKALGRVCYAGAGEDDSCHPAKEWLRRSPEKLRAVREELARAGKDDLSADLDLEILYANGAEDLPAWCRRVLAGDYSGEGKAYAAWLLGKCGSREDLDRIWALYREEREKRFGACGPDVEKRLRNYLDAIERLESRKRQETE